MATWQGMVANVRVKYQLNSKMQY